MSAAGFAASFERLDASSHFAALTFAGRRLLVPQSDVEILELLSELRPALTPGTVGEIGYRGRPWPVYSLDETLRPRVRLDASRYVCALLKSGDGGFFGIGCDEVDYLSRDQLDDTLQPVPGCMRDAGLLVSGLAVIADDPAWLVDAARLEYWLAANQERFDEPL